VDRPGRVCVLALAFLLVACATQAAAPRPSETPATSPTATPRPTNAASDVLYLRSVARTGTSIVALDARTGETLRTLPNGVMSADRSTLYAAELMNGGTETALRVLDVASGREIRSFTIPGAFQTAMPYAGQPSLSRDGRHLVLGYPPGKFENDWVSRLAVVDTSSGGIEAKLEVRSPSVFSCSGISPDGRSLYLTQSGEGATRIRVFDIATGTLLPDTDPDAAGPAQDGFRTPSVSSPDGRWLYTLDAGRATTNCTSTDGPRCQPNATPPYIVALDLVSRRVHTVALPKEQITADFEKYLLWTVGIAPGGERIYGINAALGFVNEVDARRLTLLRTATIPQSRAESGVVATLTRFFFPVAAAKRYVSTGMVFSPDGSRIYVAANKGISVVDANTLESSAVWQKDNREFDALALTADGERLYAVSNANGVIAILSTRDGASLGQIKIGSVADGILRIDSPR
jgi:DNA-binding beta-propeller fold protein YncE